MYPIPHAACCKTNSLILGDPGRRAAVGTAAPAAPKCYKCRKQTAHTPAPQTPNFISIQINSFIPLSQPPFPSPHITHRTSNLLRKPEGNNLLGKKTMGIISPSLSLSHTHCVDKSRRDTYAVSSSTSAISSIIKSTTSSVTKPNNSVRNTSGMAERGEAAAAGGAGGSPSV